MTTRRTSTDENHEYGIDSSVLASGINTGIVAEIPVRNLPL